MSVMIEQSLEKILTEISQKLENVQKDVTDIKIQLTEAKGERQVLKVEINSVRGEINSVKEDVKEIKRSQQAQIWTIIGILITAVRGFLVAVGRFVISGNP
jgi:chromosome segregation ATPase